MINHLEEKEQVFNQVSDHTFSILNQDEELTVSLDAENSFFTRINNGKVRQITKVEQGFIGLTFIKNTKLMRTSIPFCFDYERDIKTISSIITLCRKECESLPKDPFIIRPENHGSSRENFISSAPKEDILSLVLNEVSGLDFNSLITSGPIIRATANSKGQKHWFSTNNLLIDFSIYSQDKAVKELYQSREWDRELLISKLNDAKTNLELLSNPEKELSPGKYRCYFAPQAVADFINMISFGALSMRSLKEGSCAFKDLYDGKKQLSNLFSISEDFSLGIAPRFNELGEISASHLPLINKGKLVNMLISSKTAKEYDQVSNYATSAEGLNSAIVNTGTISKDKILEELYTGLYISNIHYLNWSDMTHGRITGMTRYACFWVQKGEIIGPIHNLRFDENLYNFLGKNLVNLTSFSETIPETHSYYQRQLGGVMVPGIFVDDFNFTL